MANDGDPFDEPGFTLDPHDPIDSTDDLIPELEALDAREPIETIETIQATDEENESATLDDLRGYTTLDLWLSEQRDRELDMETLDRCGNFLGSFLTVDFDEDDGYDGNGDKDHPENYQRPRWKMLPIEGSLRRALNRMLRQAANTATHILAKEEER